MTIKSFRGARKKANTEETPFKVKDYMTRKLITFKPEDSIYHAIEEIIGNRISGAPVVNNKGELVGIISESDFIKRISESRYYNMPIEGDKIEKLMSKNVDTIDGNMNVFDAASVFINSKRRRFPVLENGKLTGQISLKDILKAAMELKGHNWK